MWFFLLLGAVAPFIIIYIIVKIAVRSTLIEVRRIDDPAANALLRKEIKRAVDEIIESEPKHQLHTWIKEAVNEAIAEREHQIKETQNDN